MWYLDSKPVDRIVLGLGGFTGTKLMNKKIIKNKAKLIVQGHNQEEGIDYDETFTLVARIDAIRKFIAFASYVEFKLYQMKVKSAFLNGY